MARKSYSEEQREEIKKALLEMVLKCITENGLIHSSVDILCQKVGISKTFFYSLFDSKEELVMQALRYQQPKLLDYARKLMDEYKSDWRQGVKVFLQNCCYGAKNGIAVLSIEEEQEMRRYLSQENFQAFQRDQLIFFGKLLAVLGLSSENIDPRLFGNLALMMMMGYKAIPDTMPFLFPEAAEDMVDFQINALLDAMEKVKINTEN